MTGEWTTLRLGNLCSKIGSGATPRGGKGVYLQEGSVALIRSQNVYNDAFYREGLVYLTEEHAAGLANVEVKEHDVFLNITGDSVARSCQVAADVLPARVNQHVAIIRPNSSKLSPQFLRYFLVSRHMQNKLLALASAGATRNALTKAMVENLEIHAPESVEEQRAIAHILGTLDDKIELNRRMNETLEEMSRAIFKSWFVDFDPVRAKSEGRNPGLPEHIADLFPDRFEDSELGEIPAGWRVGELGEVITIHDSKRIPLSSRERSQRKGRYPYYGAASVMDYVDDYLFDGVYLLIGEDGSVVTADGHPVTQYVWGQFWVNNHAHVLQGKDGVSTEDVLISLSRTNINAHVTGAVQPKLNQRNMKSIPFVLASRQIHEEFGHKVSPLFDLIRANAEQSHTLASIRDALLPKLLSGEIRVTEVKEVLGDAV